MRESELLRHIYERSIGLSGVGAVVLGPGDDCAALRLHGVTLATVDQLVEGRHFELRGTTVDLIARKAVARSVSDIAAMAGTPVAALATGCLPAGFAEADTLFDRMAHWAREFACPLVGGDIAVHSGPMVLTVTVLGRAHESRGPVPRGGACVGDAVYVTGALGGSLASGRHLTFEPRLREGRWLADRLGADLHAMIDLSDGLGRDAGRVAESSGVRVEIEAGLMPRHTGVDDWRAAASDGEDYELLFVVGNEQELPGSCQETGVPISRIGRVVEGRGCVMREAGGAVVDVSEFGWEHGA